MKKHIVRILPAIAALAALASQNSQAQVIADLRTDYVQPALGDVSNGANNWWYRISPGGAYDPVSSNYTMWSDGSAFDSGGVGLYNTTPVSGLPGDPTGSNNWSNIRYVPVATQEVNITGSIKKPNAGGVDGDGITFHIRNNGGTDLFTQAIDNLDTATYTFNFNTTLTIGDNLDFLVSPNAANNYWDNFEISVTISTIYESPTVSIATYAGVTIDGVVGQTYGIQASTTMAEDSWVGVGNVTMTSATQIWHDSISIADQPKRFYRVVAGPIPIP